jgi:phosphoglycolate phosphatase-like HAD superfamily hydrolase
MNYKAVIFDWDGVITDSVNIKTEAFAEIFRPFGEKIEKQVVEYHLAHGGVSRFDKMRYFYSNFLHRTLDENELNELCLRFSTLVKDKVIVSPLVDGALETIKTAKDQGTLLFVVSGTPNDEIVEIAKAKGLAKYFTEILGSPTKKSDWIKYLLLKYQILPSQALFFGDAMEDYSAAAETKIDFIGVKIKSCATDFPYETKVISKVEL